MRAVWIGLLVFIAGCADNVDRLAERVLVFEDGAVGHVVFYDTQLGFDCTFNHLPQNEPVGDGLARCWPAAQQVVGLAHTLPDCSDEPQLARRLIGIGDSEVFVAFEFDNGPNYPLLGIFQSVPTIGYRNNSGICEWVEVSFLDAPAVEIENLDARPAPLEPTYQAGSRLEPRSDSRSVGWFDTELEIGCDPRQVGGEVLCIPPLLAGIYDYYFTNPACTRDDTRVALVDENHQAWRLGLNLAVDRERLYRVQLGPAYQLTGEGCVEATHERFTFGVATPVGDHPFLAVKEGLKKR